MIEPGKITLELLFNDPLYYILFIYVGSLIISAIAALWADGMADEKLKQNSREIDPMADTTQAYEFEHVRYPLLAGILIDIAVVFPMASAIDTVGGWQGVFSAAVLAGITARAGLGFIANKFLTKTKTLT